MYMCAAEDVMAFELASALYMKQSMAQQLLNGVQIG